MNLTEKQKQWIAWIAMALVITLISTFLGVKYPIPQPPPFLPDDIAILGTTHFTNISVEDAAVTDDLTVTDDATIGGDMTVSGTSTWGCSDTTISGDLTITGTATAEDAIITDTLDVNGDIDLDGDGFDVNITSSFSVDADAASNINVAGAGVTLTLESEAGTIIIKGDEAAADAIHLDANDAVTTGIDIDVGSVSGLTIDGGMVDIGGGTCGVADSDNDVCIAGVLEVDDEFELDGALDADSTANIAGALTLQALLYPSFADETITDGETLTPTVTIYNLDSGGAVTMTLGACSTDGQPLILVGDDANNITINDTNVRTNDGDVQVIGQYDVITWVCIDTEWVEISDTANS